MSCLELFKKRPVVGAFLSINPSFRASVTYQSLRDSRLQVYKKCTWFVKGHQLTAPFLNHTLGSTPALSGCLSGTGQDLMQKCISTSPEPQPADVCKRQLKHLHLRVELRQ